PVHMCPRVDAVCDDSRPQRGRALHRAPLSGAVRIAMADSISRPTAQAENAAAIRLRKIKDGLTRRHAKERRFRAYGIAAIVAAIGFVAILFSMILYKGLPAFTQAELTLDIHFDPE